MAVTFDAATNAGSVLTFNHTCTGTNRYLVVCVLFASATITVTGVTYNTVAMASIGTQIASNNNRVTLFGLVAPATGTNSVAITLSGASPGMANGAMSFTGADQTQTTPVGVGATGTSTTPTSGAVTGVIGDMLFDGLACPNAITVAGGGTLGWTDGAGDGQQYKQANGSSQTCSWTAASTTWASVAAVVKQAVMGPLRTFNPIPLM
jgi:hypothetical protein